MNYHICELFRAQMLLVSW